MLHLEGGFAQMKYQKSSASTINFDISLVSSSELRVPKVLDYNYNSPGKPIVNSTNSSLAECSEHYKSVISQYMYTMNIDQICQIELLLKNNIT